MKISESLSSLDKLVSNGIHNRVQVTSINVSDFSNSQTIDSYIVLCDIS